MNQRLFIGVSAPDEWKSELAAWRRSVRPRFSHSFGRWTSDANLHLTFRFLGGVDETDAISIGEELQKVTATIPAFSVSAGTLGCFPNASRPRIVWLGFKAAAEGLISLEGHVRSATARFGQPPEDRPFHPHLTLARIKEARRQDRDALADLIGKGASIQLPDWRISEVGLIRSELKPTGSVYTTLAAYRLQP